MQKFWITRYALSQGIYEFVAELDENKKRIWRRGKYSIESFYGNDWHHTKEAALEKAEQMRIKKITSLEKQIEKLTNMKFE